MGPADQDPRPESADREAGGQAGGHDRVADQRDDLASQRTDQADQRDDLADQREHAPTRGRPGSIS
jgi:hypothetical protein